uniref:Ribosomal protein L6 n=1 Tax=Cyanidium sp. THAL103 TaxID=3027999 RepID=A0A9Y1MY52_9RHOD|nr:ribosomal protein L6 [Cyanidium sp. THAL103]
MSRIGKKIIFIPKNVDIIIQNKTITVMGPKGKLSRKIPEELKIILDNYTILVLPINSKKNLKSLHGLYRTLISNMIVGVSSGFIKNLQVHGVGYKFQVNDNILIASLGYSHNIKLNSSKDISLKLEGTNILSIHGIDKEQVGKFAASVRALRPPEVYKGKGIRYIDEKIYRKIGKAGKGK